jgi:hypothetical protein
MAQCRSAEVDPEEKKKKKRHRGEPGKDVVRLGPEDYLILLEQCSQTTQGNQSPAGPMGPRTGQVVPIKVPGRNLLKQKQTAGSGGR